MSVTSAIHIVKPTNFRFIKRFRRRVKSKSERSVDLDKSWDVMSFVLTGVKGFSEGNILSEIIFPQECIIVDFLNEDGEKDSESFYFIPCEKVELINNLLQEIGEKEFRELFSKRDFNQTRTYPKRMTWDGEANFNYIYFYFKAVKNIFEKAAQNGYYAGIIRNA